MMIVYNYDPANGGLFAGAVELEDGAPLGEHQTDVPMDMDPAYRFDGTRWVYDPKLLAQVKRRNEAENTRRQAARAPERQGA
ncbi:MAG: hypothetical protein ABSG17_11280 [Spirochaetia bacterium]|jgi:hypothetical protein